MKKAILMLTTILTMGKAFGLEIEILPAKVPVELRARNTYSLVLMKGSILKQEINDVELAKLVNADQYYYVGSETSIVSQRLAFPLRRGYEAVADACARAIQTGMVFREIVQANENGFYPNGSINGFAYKIDRNQTKSPVSGHLYIMDDINHCSTMTSSN